MSLKIERNDLYSIGIIFHYIQRLILYSSFYNIIPGIIPTSAHYLSIACIALKLLLDVINEKFTVKWLLICILGIPFTLIVSMNTNSDEFFWLLYFIIAARGVKTNNLAKAVYAVCGVGTVLIVLLALLGVIPNNFELVASSDGVAVRMYMGFIHCNVFGAFLTTIFICHFYLRFYKLSIFDYIYGVFLFIISYFVAYSRTNAMIMLIAIVVIDFYIKKRSGILKITIITMLIVVAFSVICSVYYDPANQFMAEANTALTGRLSAAKQAYDEYGVSIMGQEFQTIFKSDTVAFGEVGKQQQVIDNAFMHLLVHYGIIPSIILLWYYFSNVIWLHKNNRYDLLFILFLSFLQGISEGILYSTYNIALFFVATVQYERIQERRENYNDSQWDE